MTLTQENGRNGGIRIMRLTRNDYPETRKYTGRCMDCDLSPKTEYTVAYLKGWFKDHILKTGHTVEITVEDVHN